MPFRVYPSALGTITGIERGPDGSLTVRMDLGPAIRIVPGLPWGFTAPELAQAARPGPYDRPAPAPAGTATQETHMPKDKQDTSGSGHGKSEDRGRGSDKAEREARRAEDRAEREARQAEKAAEEAARVYEFAGNDQQGPGQVRVSQTLVVVERQEGGEPFIADRASLTEVEAE